MENKQKLKFVYFPDLNIHRSYIMHNDVNTMKKQQDDQKSDLCIMITILVESIFINMRGQS